MAGSDRTAVATPSVIGAPWILLCAGMNLILAQYWIMREYQFVLASSEVSVLLAAVAFGASCSLGFLIAPSRFTRAAQWCCLLLFGVHLLLPWIFKEVAGFFYSHEWSHITVSLLGMGLLLVAPLYTTLLPLAVTARESEQDRVSGDAIRRCYAVELGGAMAGVAVILAAGHLGMLPLLTLYFLNFSLILAYVFGSHRILYLLIPVSLLYALVYLPLERTSTEDFYRSYQFEPNLHLLASAQSLYNRIDVVQNSRGEKLLLLNGREYFNPTDLESFNRYLTGIPASLMPGSKVLIVGTGSLSSAYHAARFAASVDSVEIDAQVVAMTREMFREYNHVDTLNNWRLHIDDAKHFLGSTDERYDLIAIDMVPPVYIQTALLFSREFYELVKQRLTPNGVLSVYTGAWFSERELALHQFNPAKTIDAVFPEYLVVNSKTAGMAFVYASRRLPFGAAELRGVLHASGTAGQDEVFEAAEARPRMAGIRVTSMDDLRIVLEWAPTAYRDVLTFFGAWP